jgi:TnpA family transposase
VPAGPQDLSRHRGKIHQPYCEGQKDQLAALGVVLNAVVLWKTRYIDAIVEQLRQDDSDEGW